MEKRSRHVIYFYYLSIKGLGSSFMKKQEELNKKLSVGLRELYGPAVNVTLFECRIIARSTLGTQIQRSTTDLSINGIKIQKLIYG